jgi:hypothetical protein
MQATTCGRHNPLSSGLSGNLVKGVTPPGGMPLACGVATCVLTCRAVLANVQKNFSCIAAPV